MLKIDELALSLPPTHGPRAEAIARLIGDELARLPLSRSLELCELKVPPLSLDPALPEHAVAAHVARAIFAELGRSG